MEAIEMTGKTVEEAVDAALAELGLPRDQVEIEILDEPKAGLFGLMGHPARVRVIARGANKATKIFQEEKEAPVTLPSEDKKQMASEKARELLQQIIDKMQLDARVVIKNQENGHVELDMEGPDVGILIGKHGQTINSLQYLIGIMVNRKAEEDERLRIILNAENYRERRAQLLHDLALSMARSVKERGEEAVFEPLPAIERRAIHLALKDDPDVYTYSEGEEPDRRVVISPAPAEQK